jgi:hypothetical protein
MQNSELSSLQIALSVLNNYDNSNYETYIEVSPLLYIYLKQEVQQISSLGINKYPEVLYGFKVALNPELEDYDYNIIRKGTRHAE